MPVLGIVDHLPCRFARFKLGAYFLQASCKCFDCFPNCTSNLHLLRVREEVRGTLQNWICLELLSRVNLTWDLRGSVALESKWLCPSCAPIGFDDC
jgi:hypothetical protein